MATTVTVQQIADYARTFGVLKPFLNVSGFTDQPALTIANMVKQLILAPPFAWRWNRNSTTITTVIGQQDYSVSLADFGWLEKAVLTISGVAKEMQVNLVLGVESTQARPTNIAAQLDDNAGNITFRLLPVPDQIYTVNCTYQKKATQISTIGSNWSPVPDELQFVYTDGFVAYALGIVGEEVGVDRLANDMQQFYRRLIAANAGLEETQKNLFLETKIMDLRQQQAEVLTSQQGRASRQ